MQLRDKNKMKIVINASEIHIKKNILQKPETKIRKYIKIKIIYRKRTYLLGKSKKNLLTTVHLR